LLLEFVILNEVIWFFLMNELFRYVLCFAWVVVIYLVLIPITVIVNLLSFYMLSPVVAVVHISVLLIAITFPYCPPEQIIIDNKLTQFPWEYFDDIIQCFGDPSISHIHIGKYAYNGVCSVKNDCPGNAPCICVNKGGQYSSAFAAFYDDTACGTEQAPTGQCLCWPKLDCQFLFPRIGTHELFDTNCADQYGYRTYNIVWYNTSDWIRIFKNIYRNFWISLRWVTRMLTQAYTLNSLLFMVFVTLAMLVLFYANVTGGLLLITILLGYQYGLPLWKILTINYTIPGLERIHTAFWPINVLSDWVLSFLRFPNHSAAQPLGSPQSSEATCWFFNLASFLGGGAVAFWFWGTILALVWYGLGPILWFVFNNLMVPIRMAYAVIWLQWQRSRMSRHFNKAKDLVRRSIPKWALRGANTTGGVLYHAGSRLATAMPNPPESWLTQQLNMYYADPREAWKDRLLGPELHPRPVAPIYIDGRSQGYGAGVLDYETEHSIPTTSQVPVQVYYQRTSATSPISQDPKDTGSSSSSSSSGGDGHKKQQ